ncbi:ATP-binding protein [Pelotomaculum propionicicum]|uniref:ATP-binding protein n=1 Tax=Pelotomaculum propionicicum TaxID=258475 RepID=UPI003B7A6274
MAQSEKSARQGMSKSGRSLQSIKVSYKGKVQHLKDALETKQLDLEAKCQSLQETLEDLEESRNRYAALYDFAPVGYVTLDQKGCILEINLTCASLLGLERIQLIGTPMSVLVVQSDMKMFLHHMYHCRQNGEKVITELSLTTGNGPPVQVQLLSIPQKSAGDSANCYKTVITDISERKLYERELARLDRLNLVGEMAAGIGHEVRNPMTTVRGFLQLYRDKEAFTQFKGSFDLMIEELDRANSIITEFLNLAKNKIVDLKMHNLNKILENLFPLIQADAMVLDKNIDLQLEEIPGLFLDEKEVRQLVLNLVRNGLEAMSPGGILTVRTLMDGQEVVLSVQDQGGGIEPGVLEKIGTPFFTTKEQGTGLGLAVCYSIAARHNALINIETGSSGTTFFIKFKNLKEQL